MARLVSTLLVVGLLAGTAAAFAVTERLKLQTSPISRTRIDNGTAGANVFSPVCGCPSDRAHIAFSVAKRDGVTLSIVDMNDRPVRTLVLDQRLQGYQHFTWNGRDAGGQVVPQGSYRIRIQLSGLDRTFTPPNTIQVDTTAPRIVSAKVQPRVFSPDGDRRADWIVVDYRVNEPSSATLLVNGRSRVQTKIREQAKPLFWFGKVGGRPFRAGKYRLQLVVRDQAGNRSRSKPLGVVRIRFIRIVSEPIDAVAGRRTRVFVSTDARAYRWRVGKRDGLAHKRLLLLPRLKAGRYTLLVSTRGHSDSAPVVVRQAGAAARGG